VSAPTAYAFFLNKKVLGLPKQKREEEKDPENRCVESVNDDGYDLVKVTHGLRTPFFRSLALTRFLPLRIAQFYGIDKHPFVLW
jgi:hypothetical protein